MKKILFAATALLSLSAFAHEDHDWRQDYQAYLSVSYELPSIPFKRKQTPSRTRLDMNFFKAKLEVLAGVTPYQGVVINERKSLDGLNRTRAFLKEEYERLGFTVSFQPFGSGTNFIAEKTGTTTPDKVLVLSSHIDSVGNKGANDNGTGTIGLLTVAQELSRNNYSSTIRVLGFDREEQGLVGSDAYVATIAKKENIIGNINFEMMGHHSRQDGRFHVIDCDRKESLFLSSAIKEAISNLDLGLSVVKTCTDRSDHASFWRKKIPAVVISENFFGGDADPCYHARCDVVDERLNYGYMQKILDATLAATEKLAR